MQIRNLFLLVILASVLSCAEKVEPVAPEVGQLPKVEYRESSVTLPINFDIRQLQNMLNTKIPKGLVHHAINPISGLSNSDIHIYRNDPIGFTVQENKLRFTIPIKITAYGAKRKNIFGLGTITKTGRGEAFTVIFLDVNLSLNQDYSFTASTNLDYDLKKAKIRISLLGDLGRFVGDPHASISIRSFVRPKIDDAIKKALPDLNGLIQNELNKFNLRETVQKYWTESGKPVEVDENVWISSNPKSIQFNNISSDGKTANIKVGLSSVLKLKVGNQPETFDSEVPNIEINQLEEGHFNIYLPTVIQFSELQNKINEEVSGKTYISEDNEHKVTINNVRIYGSNITNSRVVIGIDFKGKVGGIFNKSLKGILWFNVLPVYNPETGIVSLEDLEFTPETDNVIADKAIPWLLDKFYMNEFLDKAKIDLSSEIDKHKNTLNNEFSEIELDNLTIFGSLEDLVFEGFRIEQNQLSLIVAARGSLNSTFKE